MDTGGDASQTRGMDSVDSPPPVKIDVDGGGNGAPHVVVIENGDKGNIHLQIGDNKNTEGMGNGHSESVTITQITPAAGDAVMKQIHSGEKKELDDLFPATSLWTTQRDGAVKLRMSDTGAASRKPVTVQTAMKETVNRLPNNTALAVKREGVWVKWTYQQYYDDVIKAAKAMILLGVEQHHAVGILGFNAPEWFIAYLAAIYAGGQALGIYATNSPEACEFVLSDSEANLIFVEDNAQLQKILKVWDTLPHLKAIVQYTGEVAERRKNIYSWEEFMKLSTDVPWSAVEERFAHQAPNTCASLVYTSGTTGTPKAVMLSHDNLMWTANNSLRVLKHAYGKEITISYLPLSHIAAQMLDLLMSLQWGKAVYFAQPDALKGSLVETLKEVRPTEFFAVPRIWEKIAEKLQAAGSQTTGMKRKIAIWAKGVGLRGTHAKINKQSLPWGWTIANALVFKKVRAALGLDRCRLFAYGAAPISAVTLDYFASLNIRLDAVYGMSESSGPQTYNTDEDIELYSLGKHQVGTDTRLDNMDQDKEGEACFWGRHVFMGYLNHEEKTRETIGPDGWLRSGDLGKLVNGFLYLTGRIKELIITAGGENIAPVPVEDLVKEELPIISNSMLIGDARKFLSMLLTLKVEVNLDTNEPLSTLSKPAQDWCRSVGSSATTVADVLADKDVLRAIQAGMDNVNNRVVSRASKVQKWSILLVDFSIPGGELGPTMKLRRPIVVKKYEKTISAFYED